MVIQSLISVLTVRRGGLGVGVENNVGLTLNVNFSNFDSPLSEILHRESNFCNDYFLLKFENDRGWRGMVEAVQEFSLELFSFKISPLGFLWDVDRRVI